MRNKRNAMIRPVFHVYPFQFCGVLQRLLLRFAGSFVM